MVKNNIIIVAILFCFSLTAQNKKFIFNGKIINDNASVENVHIINKNNNRVAISNKSGEFEIPAKINDTLVFTAVQFATYQRIVVPQDVRKLQIIIKLKIQTNTLSEVTLERNSVAKELGLPNAHKKPLTKLEARIEGHSKASVPLVILGTLIGGAGGIDNLFYVLSGKRKKDRKLQQLIQEDKLIALNNETKQRIKEHFKKDFFIYTLKIEAKKIDDFIDYCIPKNIITLFNENKTLEVTEIFIQQSKEYLKEE